MFSSPESRKGSLTTHPDAEARMKMLANLASRHPGKPQATKSADENWQARGNR